MSAPAPWHPNGAAFCWQPKAALVKLEQGLARSQAATAKLVYLALSRLASGEDSATFSKPIDLVAQLASLDRRTVERRLVDLERLKLVKIQRSKLRAPHQFTLTTYSRNDTSQSRSVTANLTSQSRIPYIRELEKGGTRPPTQSETITLEKQKRVLEAQLEKAQDANAYDHRRTKETVAEEKRVGAELERVNQRILEVRV